MTEKIFLVKMTESGFHELCYKHKIGFDTTFFKSCVELSKEEIKLLEKALAKYEDMEYELKVILLKKLERI